MLYKTLRLSPPSGGGSDVAISFSIFPFFFLFSSTNNIQNTPRCSLLLSSLCSLCRLCSFLFQVRRGRRGLRGTGNTPHPQGDRGWGSPPRPSQTRRCQPRDQTRAPGLRCSLRPASAIILCTQYIISLRLLLMGFCLFELIFGCFSSLAICFL